MAESPGFDAQAEAQRQLSRWTPSTTPSQLFGHEISIYSAGDFVIEGRPVKVGRGVKREWTLLYQGVLISKPARRDEAKRDAVAYLAQQLQARQEQAVDEVVVRLTAEEARALAQAATYGYQALREDQRTGWLDAARRKLNKARGAA